MILVLEYFIGIIAAFAIGYVLATLLEKIFHLTLIESDKNE
jgi:hypothetical protein